MALTEDDSQMVRNMIRTNIISLLNNETSNYNKNPKKFFLTQFHDKEEDDNNNNNKNSNTKTELVPLNTGKAGVLKQGLELRLQRNILEKYRTDEEAVTKNLVKKRQEFEQRVNICKEKQGELAVRQKQNQDLIVQYSQFINEKESIRKRAIVKYQSELKLRLQKMLEYDILMKELEETRKKHEEFSLKVEKNKKFKDFLSKAIELLPENYLEAGESKFISLMMRHQTLFESNVDLFDNLIANSDKVKTLRNEYEKLIIEHNSNKMTVNSKLGELSQIKEQLNLKNARTEESLLKDSDRKREKVIDLSKIFWGIDNLAAKCMDKYRLANRTIEQVSLSEKLESIQEYIINQQEILKMVKTD